ncbi:MAG TPA: MBL fold metallo-hydrolase, partial [Thermodesulforhabdus norvegica]|nr:MBL fold metallo-hydrolase [Thermodesulforhabdus norvegica]
TIFYWGNTTCLEVPLESGRKVIVDAGTGIRRLGEQFQASGDPVDIHLLITHIHWDHVLGFPFFAPIFDPATKIIIDGYPTCMKGLRYTFDNKMGDGFFPVRFDDLKATIDYLDEIQQKPLRIDGAVIDTIPINHPQGGFGYRFQENDTKVVFITDNELTQKGKKTVHEKECVRFCEGADVLIHDAQYTPDEISDRKGWGHSDYLSAVNLGIAASVSRLILFHHDPTRKDPEVTAIKKACDNHVSSSGVKMEVEAAVEETEITL